jgi:hypothetical protein
VRHDALADHDVARRRLLQPGDAAEYRRFPAARRAEQDEQFSVPHVEIKMMQCLDATVEDFAQAAQRDRRHPLCP